jgi:integrase
MKSTRTACGLATAVREGMLRSNPARDVDLPHRPTIEEDSDDVQPLTTEQLTTFLRVVSPRYTLFFVLLAASGLRISEAIALTWKDVHLDGSSPHLRIRRRIVRGEVGPPKSKYGRRDVPIAFELVRDLREYKKATEYPRPDDPVFATREGTPYSPSNLRRDALKPAAEEAGAPWAGFHTFRHTCASMLFANGRNAVQVQRWLGHHSAAFTLSTYVHLLDDDLGAPLALPIASDAGPSIDDALTRANNLQTDVTSNHDRRAA